MGGISSHGMPEDSFSHVMDTSTSHLGAIDGESVGRDVGEEVGPYVGYEVGKDVGLGVGDDVGTRVTIFSVGIGVGAAGQGKFSGTTGQMQSHVAHLPPHPAKQHLGTPSESRSSVQALKAFITGGAPFPLPFPVFQKINRDQATNGE